MGSSSSTDHQQSSDQKEQESLASSTISLPILKYAFSNLSNPQSQTISLSSLNKSLSLSQTLTLILPSSHPTTNFLLLLPHIGPASSHLLLPAGNHAADWPTFLRAFNRCSAPMPFSSSIIILHTLFSDVCGEAGIENGKLGRAFGLSDLVMFFWFCWVLEHGWRFCEGGEFLLPDLRHLVMSAILGCGDVGSEEGLWGLEGLGVEKIVEVEKLNGWILATVPGMASCFSRFLREKIRSFAVSAENSIKSNLPESSGSSTNINDSFLLTFGTAWAISLTQKSTLAEELSAASFPGLFNHKLNNLPYRCSLQVGDWNNRHRMLYV